MPAAERRPFQRPLGAAALGGSRSVEQVLLARAGGAPRARALPRERAAAAPPPRTCLERLAAPADGAASHDALPFAHGAAHVPSLLRRKPPAKAALAQLARSSGRAPAEAAATLPPPYGAEAARLVARIDGLARALAHAEADLAGAAGLDADARRHGRRDGRGRDDHGGFDAPPPTAHFAPAATAPSPATAAEAPPAEADASRPAEADASHPAEADASRPTTADASLRAEAARLSQLRRRGSASVGDSLQRMDATMQQLQRHHGQLAEPRHMVEARAALLVTSLARGRAARRRWKRCKKALRKLRLFAAAPLLDIVRSEVLRQLRLERIVFGISMERGMRRTARCFSAWAAEAASNREAVGKMKLKMAASKKKRDALFLAAILRAWRGDAAGGRSRRNCVARRRLRLAEARGAIFDREEAAAALHERPRQTCVITPAMVEVEVSRRIYAKSRLRGLFWAVKIAFCGFKAVAFTRPRASLLEAARRHRFNALRGCFAPWAAHALNHAGAVAAPKRYSQALVDRFARRSALRRVGAPCFAAWQRRRLLARAAAKVARRTDTEVLLAPLHAWTAAVSKRRRLRSMAVQNWLAAGRLLVLRPLQAWYLLTKQRRTTRLDQKRLVSIHTRTRTRRLFVKMLRCWRHQAIYGRVEGLYTRAELVRSLVELEATGRRLEARADAHTFSCDAAASRLDDERDRAIRSASRLADRDARLQSMQLALHHGAAEVHRIAVAIECVATLHPDVTRASLRRALDARDAVESPESARVMPFAADSALHELVHNEDDLTKRAPTHPAVDDSRDDDSRDDDSLPDSDADSLPDQPSPEEAAPGDANEAGQGVSEDVSEGVSGDGVSEDGAAHGGGAASLEEAAVAGLPPSPRPCEAAVREAVYWRARWVLQQSQADFRAVGKERFGGKHVYAEAGGVDAAAASAAAAADDSASLGTLGSASLGTTSLASPRGRGHAWRCGARDEALDVAMKLCRDAAPAWALWAWLFDGRGPPTLPEPLAERWKDAEAVFIRVDAAWPSLARPTVRGSKRLPNWAEFERAVTEPGAHGY
ncbi:hypothetical protein M885DRAFT_537088 [Pelagophyceae sp. CCMP2097]|nr:hypothetical protein M885DRAFT_537088 [Pelagophyceae sp. CCMP2097]